MKLSDRDKKLLYLLAIAVIILLAFFFGYRNLTEATVATRRIYNEMNAEYMDLQAKYSRIEQYRADRQKYELLYEAMLAKYPAGYTQEYLIMFLANTEDKTGIWFSQASLTNTTQSYNFGMYSSSNPSSSRYKLDTDLQGYTTTISLTYEATYDEFKNFISYMEGYHEKYSINSISTTYKEEEKLVSGTLELTQYAIAGNREFSNVKVPAISIGTDNIFDSSTFSADNGSYDDTDGARIIYDYDLYMILNAETADVDSIIMGVKGDDKTMLTANSNKTEDVYIKITGEDGSYRIQYKVGTEQYPEANYDMGADFEPGNTLDLLVISNERADGKDLSGAKVTIENESDMRLNIKVVNDDQYNPRYTAYSVDGDVKTY